MSGDADEVLMRRVAASGDERAISELYDRYAGLVYGAGVRYLRDRALAEDLVQDVFTAVWRSAASFDPSRENATSFTVSVCPRTVRTRAPVRASRT